ncbi:MAG: tRNA(Ile)-lysidine synthetase, partial [Gammaproteobacteria bacterium]
GDRLAIAPLKALPPERQRNALRRWLDIRGLPPPPESRLATLLDQIEAPRDRMPRVAWAGGEVRRHGGFLHAFPSLPPRERAPLSWDFRTPLVTSFGVLSAVPTHGEGLRAFDGVEVRWREGGERLRLGGKTRSLKKLLQEKGLPPWERERLPLLYVKGELAAVADLWVADPFAPGQGEAGWLIRWQKKKGAEAPKS